MTAIPVRFLVSDKSQRATTLQGRLRSTVVKNTISITTYVTGMLLAAAISPLKADLIRLKNGGEIRGKLERSRTAEASSDITITTLTGARVTVHREDIEFAAPRSLKIEEYETRARKIPHTVDAHEELAEWCREKRLNRQRHEQLEQILLIEPNHEAARRGLGYTLHGAKWMTRHEAMLAEGYIRHEGRYVTQQELDLIEKTKAQRDAEQAWTEKVRLWLGWATGRHQARMAEGLLNLQEIRDPDAIPALARFMAEDDDAQVRMFFVRLLAKLDGPRPVAPLVHRTLVDTVPEIRSEALHALNHFRHKMAIALFVAALQNELRLIVRRSAYALGEMGDRSVVPRLIDALVTQHRYRVTYQVPSRSFSLGSDGGIGMASPTSGLPPQVEALARTGQLPYGAVVIPPPNSTVTRTTVVKRSERNIEVLTALKKLTDQNFGFDERTWHLWWAAIENGSGTNP